MIQELKQAEYAKYLAANYAPDNKKQALAAIFMFGLEIEKTPTYISEPMVGHVKLQWWRDVITEVIQGKPPRPHPILLSLKGHNINYQPLLELLDKYDDVIENKLPENLVELLVFLQNTECKILQVAAEFLQTPYNQNIATAYAYCRYAIKLRVKNPQLAQQLFAQSAKLNASSKSIFSKITAFYIKRPNAANWQLALSLLAKKSELL